jgi:hypothetical protein
MLIILYHQLHHHLLLVFHHQLHQLQLKQLQVLLLEGKNIRML